MRTKIPTEQIRLKEPSLSDSSLQDVQLLTTLPLPNRSPGKLSPNPPGQK